MEMVKLIALLEGGGNTRFPEKVQNCHKSQKKLPLVSKKKFQTLPNFCHNITAAGNVFNL